MIAYYSEPGFYFDCDVISLLSLFAGVLELVTGDGIIQHDSSGRNMLSIARLAATGD